MVSTCNSKTYPVFSFYQDFVFEVWGVVAKCPCHGTVFRLQRIWAHSIVKCVYRTPSGRLVYHCLLPFAKAHSTLAEKTEGKVHGSGSRRCLDHRLGFLFYFSSLSTHAFFAGGNSGGGDSGGGDGDGVVLKL